MNAIIVNINIVKVSLIHEPIARRVDAIDNYRKIQIISPGFIFAQKAFSLGLSFGGAYFRRGLLSEGILGFKMGLACQ